MLKFVADEASRAKALEVAATCKKLFAGPEWGSVMAKLQRFADEDPLRVTSPAQLTTSTSAPPALVVDETTPPAALLRARTSTDLLLLCRDGAPSTPRPRWDVVGRSPATPLTPTPTGNAFAPGGFWQHLSPMTPLTSTPITAIPASPYKPSVPEDAEARAAYDQVKADGDVMARKICATRMSAFSKFSANSDDIPMSLIRPRDELKGAQVTLHHRQVQLKSSIDPDFPKKLRDLAEEESKILEQYSINNKYELSDIEVWLQVDEPTLNFTTILDAQREHLRMHRHRRKSTLLKVSDRAIQQAWATRILEDAEQAVEAQGDTSSTNSDEERGYDYNNFLRTMGRGASSSSDLVSMVSMLDTDSASYRSSATNADGLPLSRQTTHASTSASISPNKSAPNTLALRSREASISHTGHSTPETRITTLIKEDSDHDVTTALVSPEIKIERRKGLVHTDASTWSEDLRHMEARTKAKKALQLAALHRQHPAFRHRRASSADSWKCEEAVKHERAASRDDGQAAEGSMEEPPPAPTTETFSDAPLALPSRSRPSSTSTTFGLPPPIPAAPPLVPTQPRHYVRSKSRIASASGTEEEKGDECVVDMEDKERMGTEEFVKMKEDEINKIEKNWRGRAW
jgi:hypothetical protein